MRSMRSSLVPIDGMLNIEPRVDAPETHAAWARATGRSAGTDRFASPALPSGQFAAGLPSLNKVRQVKVYSRSK